MGGKYTQECEGGSGREVERGRSGNLPISQCLIKPVHCMVIYFNVLLYNVLQIP